MEPTATNATTTAIIRDCIEEVLRCLDRDSRTKDSTAPTPASIAVSDQARVIIDEEWRAIDYIKARVEERQKHIGRRRNNLAPIHRLPNEILGIIFKLVKREASPVGFNDFLSVSHRWRIIALNTPSLWTNIHNLSGPLLDVFIARSKQHSLEVSYGRPEDRSDSSALLEYLAHISPYVQGWRTCQLFGPLRARAEILSYLTTPAPTLETLSISLYKARGDGVDDAELDDDTGPFNPLFGGSAPRLRELALDGAFVSLSSPIFSGLTKLELGRISYSSADSNSPFLLLHAIESCPLLEVLMLTDIYIASDPHLDPAPSSLELPYLQIFRMSQAYSMQWLHYHILDCVVIPPSSSLELHVANCARTGDMDVVSGPLPRFTRSYLGLQNISTVKHLTIWLTGDMTCRVEGYTSDTSKCSFLFYICTGQLAFSHTLLTLHPAFPMPLESLALSALSANIPSFEIDTTIFAGFLRHHPLIRKLKFEHFSTPAIQVLGVTPNQYLCPRLEELHVVNCPIGIRELIDLVRPRVKAGVEEGASAERATHLERLRIGECPDASQLASLDVPKSLKVILERKLFAARRWR
ncbi:hypothetical protein BOTBODRAFT_38891 [Botryobasidium botryosum FD-172 SS1]|uniref:Uncharacterized protein n=1 Tax=Botryobasidium botryosum (strain FD-172 SS1) TaxID=930990 RepID=A0A067LW47_BOTB1|nr:hypothetical protein BOTBODRAFT_38891 [Botryobasidium botryosum FD-172 SS1]